MVGEFVCVCMYVCTCTGVSLWSCSRYVYRMKEAVCNICDVHADVIRMCICVCEVILYSCDVRLGGSNINVCKRKYTDLVACDVKL